MRARTSMLSAVLFLSCLFSSAHAQAHEVLHEVQRGAAIAVKAYFSDGEVLADATYEVYSPTNTKTPYQRGHTDRSGWLAFVPATRGAWHVKVISATGHGVAIDVEAEPTTPPVLANAATVAAPPAPATPAPAASTTATSAATAMAIASTPTAILPAASANSCPATWSFVLRPLVGIAAIGAIFVALAFVYKKKKT